MLGLLPATLASLVAFWVAARPILSVNARESATNVGGYPLFPADNMWNRDISALLVAPTSAA